MKMYLINSDRFKGKNAINKKIESNKNTDTDNRVEYIEDHSAYFDSAIKGGRQHALKRTMRDSSGAEIN
jgi:hypothetical protein